MKTRRSNSAMPPRCLVEDLIMRQYLSKYVPKVNQADFNKEVQELTTP